MSNKKLLVQGDVVLEPVDIFSDGKKMMPDQRGYVLAEGEQTGHCHKIVKTESVTMIEANGKIYLRVTEAVPLHHEEHHIIIIEPGEYEVRKQLERDHFSRITREVID